MFRPCGIECSRRNEQVAICRVLHPHDALRVHSHTFRGRLNGNEDVREVISVNGNVGGHCRQHGKNVMKCIDNVEYMLKLVNTACMSIFNVVVDPMFYNKKAIQCGKAFWELGKEMSLNLSVPRTKEITTRMFRTQTSAELSDESK